MEITIEQARAKAYEWRGEAGGEVLPPLTANELAGLINEHVRELLGEPVGIVARSPMAATVGWTCDLPHNTRLYALRYNAIYTANPAV